MYVAKRYGIKEAAKKFLNPGASDKDFHNHVIGWLSYFKQVRGDFDPRLKKQCALAAEAGIKLPKWAEEINTVDRAYDVFLSHASEDKDEIRKLDGFLKKNGIRTFFDEASINYGESIPAAINEALKKSYIFMPHLSDKFAKKGWTNKELNAALAKYVAGQENRIFPVKMPGFDVQTEYPILNDIKYFSWKTGKGQERFFEDILAAIRSMKENLKHEYPVPPDPRPQKLGYIAKFLELFRWPSRGCR